MLDAMPASTFTALVVVVLIMLFYVAGADSAALVLGMFNQRGSLRPKTWLVVVWGCMIGAVAIALLLAGGLSAIQTTVIVFGLPFIAVMFWVCYSLVERLRAEPVTTTVPPGAAQWWRSSVARRPRPRRTVLPRPGSCAADGPAHDP